MFGEYRRRYSYRDLRELLHAARLQDATLAKVMEHNRHAFMSPEEEMTFAVLFLAADNQRLREDLSRLSTNRVLSPPA